MLFYTLADCLSLIATLLLLLQLNLVAIGWFHFLMSTCMLVTVYIHDTRRYLLKGILLNVFLATMISLCIWVHVGLYNTFLEYTIIGTCVAWVTTCLYILGRIPQLIHNYKRRSTEGLSKLMYVFTILGNMCYLLSIVSYSIDPEYIYLNVPWIVLTIVNSCLDMLIIIQYYYYKKTVNTVNTDVQSTIT